MPWLKLELEADCNCVEAVAQVLEQCGALAITVSDAKDQALYQAGAGGAVYWAHNRISGLFSADVDVGAVARRLQPYTYETPTYRVETLPERDWQSACKERHGPMRFGANLWVRPSWSAPPEDGAVDVLIDPGLAFGSGAHATTRLCLAWLAEHACDGKQVIDYGCGSGILAIAALKLGAMRAWGIDNDPRALQVSAANATLNHVATRYRALTPESLPTGLAADIVLANILADPLAALAPRLIELLKPGGILILSGLLEEQADSVRSCYASRCPLALHVAADGPRGHRWVMLVGRRDR